MKCDLSMTQLRYKFEIRIHKYYDFSLFHIFFIVDF